MKKNILASLLLATGFLHAEATTIDPYENAPRLSSPDHDCGIFVGDKWKSYEEIVTTEDFGKCLSRTYDLEFFKDLEKRFQAKGLRIYSARLYGKTPLQQVMKFYEEDIDNGKIAKEQADALFDYILSQMTTNEINECVETAYEPGIYYGTHAAFAAMHSATCLRKILARPDFDPSNFLSSRVALHHRVERWQPFWSLTPQQCVDILIYQLNGYEYQKRNARLIHAELLITLLKEAFPNQCSQTN